ncbi:hypothetical protein [Streptomyces tauricus]|uniref:hypothetical protein n=1 Tax=Streptomyces tauricus TaxID=68274 RepID=UPI002242E4E2|nr:hypothetical protein [Streptomyces tauricus]MCW8099784.1 hypothetical protein [Streptomyces tauricus]
MSHRPPLGAPAVWQAVMEGAGYRCHCTGGTCGSRHARSELRCHRTADNHRLIAAPAALLLTAAEAAALPAGELLAWCPQCHTGALARQRAAARDLARSQASEPAGLFDL